MSRRPPLRTATSPVTASGTERLVLVVASALMWIPCLLVLLVGAPLLVTGLLGLSAGTMTVQVVGSRGGTSRFSRWAERAFRC